MITIILQLSLMSCSSMFKVDYKFITKALDKTDKKGNTRLMKAVNDGDLVKVKSLLEKGANVGQQGENEMSSLMLAAREGHTEIFELLLNSLLDKKTVIEQEELSGCTSLILASKKGNIKIVERLLLEGANTNKTDNIQNMTSLMWALSSRRIEIANMILEKDIDNIDIEVTGSIELTSLINISLINASLLGRTNIVLKLLDRGANIDYKDSNGRIPIVSALSAQHCDTALRLLDRGASVEVEDK